ncbi:M50 family metallopeptidase [Bacillus ectoiniformans]|uniref:M50 family metallopeptidase n=1 Tax=Bacillus ectoiniformans TaxID=1494429 RepID=UPI0030842A2B
MLKLAEKTHVHPLTWCMLGAGALTGRFMDWLIVFSMIAIHELGHVAMAHYYKWRIKRVMFLPFGGVAEVDEHGNRPVKEELMVILAGPAQHIWMFALTFFLYQGGVISESFFSQITQLNAAIFLFNLLPIYPLDGGKLVMLYFSVKKSFIAAQYWSIISSLAVLILLQAAVVLLFPFHLQAWLLFGYLAISLWQEWKQRRYAFLRFLLERHYGNKGTAGKLKTLYVSGNEPILQVLERFWRNSKHIVYISDEGKDQTRLDENEILHAYFSEKRTSATMNELLLPLD